MCCSVCMWFVGLAKSHWPMTSYRPNFITNARFALVAAAVSTYYSAAHAAAAAATVRWRPVRTHGFSGSRERRTFANAQEEG